MNTTRLAAGGATLLVAIAVFPLLGPAVAQARPRPEPLVSGAEVAPNGIARDQHGYAYLGKQQAILDHLDRAPRFGPDSVIDGADLIAATGGVARDQHGYAYLGRQQAILDHLDRALRFDH